MPLRQAAGIRLFRSLSAIDKWKVDGCWIIVVTLLALVIRLPYWRTIPAAGDEVGQVIYALRIAQGQNLPLVGNDAYAGPFFFYLLALLFRVGVGDPLVGRTIVMVTGTLTVTVTYAWVRQLRGTRVAGLVSALLVAANPHLVLLNSHVGGTTFLLPFFTTLFLLFLSRAVYTKQYGWWIAAAVVGGLAIQSNPVAGLLVAGGWLWGTFRVWRCPRLSRRCILWPLVGGFCVALVYSPVIVYNVMSSLNSLDVAGQRSYLWETNPTFHTALTNELRLALQLIRQVSGVLRGDETIRTVLGLPLIYLVWMLAGLAVTARKTALLPIVVTLPYLLVLPYFSSHYGLVAPVRFTSLLTPIFDAGMGLFFAAVLERIKFNRSLGQWMAIVTCILVALLAVYPLVSLFWYYDFTEKNHQSGQVLLELSRQMVDVNRGEPVYISNQGLAQGIPYVPQAYLLLANLHQELLPPEQIIGRLFEFSGPAMMLLGNQDAAIVQEAAHLIPLSGTANEEARQLGYGLYTLNTKVALVKPQFVLTGTFAMKVAPRVSVGVRLGEVELIGYDVPARIVPGQTLTLIFYWRKVGSMPHNDYIGFVHLYDPITSALIRQDDHLLGQARYPVSAWQPGEIVVERYSLPVPNDLPTSQYGLRSGVYTWPDMVRLDVPGHPDNIIELKPIDIVGQ